MNKFWQQVSRRDLKEMEQPGWEYPGDDAIYEQFKRKKSGNRSRTWLLRVGVAAAVIAVLTVGSVAAYQYWHMPTESETYSGDVVQVHETQTYPVPTEEPSAPTRPQGGDPADEGLTDEWFIGQAAAVLSAVNKMPVDTEQLTLTRQKDQRWDREEVEITMDTDEGPVAVSFDAMDGVLLHVVAFDAPYSGGDTLTEDEALAVAQSYYDTLPYARGYEFTDLTRFDEDMWMYAFSKPYTIEGQTIWSPYEQVRITINPLNGHFQMSNCFYVPLLTEHDPDQPALTMEQARQIAESWAYFTPDWRNYDCRAELGIVNPAPYTVPRGEQEVTGEEEYEEDYTVSIGSPEEIQGYVAYGITRPAWVLNYEGTYCVDDSDVGFADGGTICVDLYTGEILFMDFIG